MRRNFSCACGKNHSPSEHPGFSDDGIVEEALLRASSRHRSCDAASSRRSAPALPFRTFHVFPLGAAKEAFAQGAGRSKRPS
jgi:hypothetical protein